MLFDKGSKAVQWRKASLFKWCWAAGEPQVKKKKSLDTDLIPITTINSKWNIYLHAKCRTIKLLKDKVTQGKI